MQNYFLKTKYNKQKTSELEAAIQSVGLSTLTIDEHFSSENNDIRDLGVQSVPSVVAVHTDVETGEKTLIHQESSPFQMATFQSNADTKLADFLAE